MYFVQRSYIFNITYINLTNDNGLPAAMRLQALVKGMVIRMESVNKTGTPQVSPYDDSAWEHYSMYDNMPYVWDPDLNAMNIFTIVTGNLIKSYRCVMKDPLEIKHE